MIAGIETGGTKVVCGVADTAHPGTLLTERRFPTTGPAETFAAINAFLDEAERDAPLDGIGIASFGPVNVAPGGPRYGWITGSTKLAWRGARLLDSIPATGRTPTALLSDVSGAALGEQRLGAGRGARDVAFATFGTGVGVGIVRDGRVLHGDGYPELGHLLVRRHPRDSYPGRCPFHGDCLEGLAAGPAVRGRWGTDSSGIPAEQRDEAFDVLGFYVAQVAAVVAYTVGVERVVLGGGVLKAPGLLDVVRRRFDSVTGGPDAGHAIDVPAEELLVAPALGDRSGVLGALAAASDIAEAAPAREPVGSGLV